jgi:type IV pilus assembly protein PilP
MNASPIKQIMKNSLILILATFGLAACGGDMDDLDQYINEIKARPGGRIDPLPEITPYEVFTYVAGGRIDPLPEITPYEVFTYVADAQGLRSPFVPDTPQASGGAAGGARPDPDRSREYLEASRWIRLAWLEPCISARPCTDSCKRRTA